MKDQKSFIIIGNKLIIEILEKLSVTKKILKVNWVFDFGHLFLSISENLNLFWKNCCRKLVCEHNALVSVFRSGLL
jgi:hypothetical protein